MGSRSDHRSTPDHEQVAAYGRHPNRSGGCVAAPPEWRSNTRHVSVAKRVVAVVSRQCGLTGLCFAHILAERTHFVTASRVLAHLVDSHGKRVEATPYHIRALGVQDCLFAHRDL